MLGSIEMPDIQHCPQVSLQFLLQKFLLLHHFDLLHLLWHSLSEASFLHVRGVVVGAEVVLATGQLASQKPHLP